MRHWFGKKRKPKAYVVSTSSPAQLIPAGVVARSQGQAEHTFCQTVYALPSRQISHKQQRRAQVRIGMAGVCFALAFLGLGVRLSDVSFSSALPGTKYYRQVENAGPRPDIVDRNGVLLATNLPTTALEVSGKEVWDAHETATALAEVLEDIDVAGLTAKLSRGQYVEVRSDLTPAERDQVFDLGLPGVRFSVRDYRFYPQEGLAAHLVGHVEKGQVRAGEGGVMGLEKVLDRQPEPEMLTSSIDIRVQQIMEELIVAGVNEFSAEAGWGVMMDLASGEIIAIASYPEFNLNDPSAFSADARRNRVSYDRYDLGSAFKVITAASAIEAGIADEDTLYDARKGYKVAGVTFRDYKGKDRILTLSEVVQHSSNIGSVQMARQMGTAVQQSFLEKLGFFGPLPIVLSENRAPDLPAKWGPVESATVSYGHGIAVTPLHLLAGFAAVVSGGEYRTPVFLKGASPAQSKRVFAEATAIKMRRVLRRTVLNGSAKRAEVSGYFPIGKTSTADKPGPGGYRKDARISSFVGAFPGYAPRYAVLVSLDNPQPTDYTYGYATAGWTAAPIFKKLLERVAPILDIPVVDDGTAMQGFFADYNNVPQKEDALFRKAVQDITTVAVSSPATGGR